MRRLIAPAAAALLLTVGCGASTLDPRGSASATSVSDAATPTPTPSPTPTPNDIPTPEPSDPTSVLDPTSLTDLKNDLEDDGLSCDDWEVTVKNVQGSCNDLIILGFSDSTKKRDKLMKASVDLAWQAVQAADREDDIAVVVGDNWWMRVARADAETLDDIGIGGKILD